MTFLKDYSAKWTTVTWSDLGSSLQSSGLHNDLRVDVPFRLPGFRVSHRSPGMTNCLEWLAGSEDFVSEQEPKATKESLYAGKDCFAE